MFKRYLLILGLGVGLCGCSASAGGDATPTPSPAETSTPSATESASPSATPSASPSADASKYHGLVPFPGVDAPAITEVVPVLMKTDVGDIHIEVYPQAAPNSAKRFLELVEKGFYNDTPLFRVVKTPEPFVVQFGVNWRKPFNEEKEHRFKEDPTLFELERGTLCFAKTNEPDSASTQVFIDYKNNEFLRSMNFTVFGRVTKGMEVADKFREGELDQMQLWVDGGNYLKSLPAQPSKIIKMEVVKPKKDKK